LSVDTWMDHLVYYILIVKTIVNVWQGTTTRCGHYCLSLLGCDDTLNTQAVITIFKKSIPSRTR